jgi:hypothetical protein
MGEVLQKKLIKKFTKSSHIEKSLAKVLKNTDYCGDTFDQEKVCL